MTLCRDVSAILRFSKQICVFGEMVSDMNFILVAIIGGLLIIAIFMWSNEGGKAKDIETATPATPQVEEKAQVSSLSETPKKKKKKSKKRKKKSKKKGKTQQNAEAAPDTKESTKESKQQNQKQNKSDSKKKPPATKKAPKPSATKKAPKKQSPPADGGGWVTAGKKKKKKQPRGGFDPTAQSANVSTYVVPTKKLGILIGPKGKTLRAIEEKSGCKINTPQDRSASRKDATVTLTGSAQQRSLGKAILKDLVELGFSPRLQQGMKMHNVSVSQSLLPLLRGNRFSALKALEADANVKISIPENIRGSANSVRVKVAGTARGIEKTKKNLTQLNMHYHCEATHPGFVHKEIYNCDLALLVGPKGQTIKSIQGDTKATVHTPRRGSANQNVVITGTKAQVLKALNQVQRVLGTDLKTLTTKTAPPVDDDFYMVEEEDVEDYPAQ